MVKSLCEDLAFDMSTAGVRSAALDALSKVAENPQAHSAITTNISSISPLMWDKSPRVRSSLLKLLRVVDRHPNFKVSFTDVVSSK